MQPTIHRRIIKILPRKIRIPPYYIRKYLINIPRITRSIKKIGQIKLITITEDCYLFDGKRRFQRYSKGRRKIEVMQLIGVNVNNMLDYQLECTFNSEDLNDIEKAHALRAFMRHNKLSVKETAERRDMSKNTLKSYLNCLLLPREIQEKIVIGEMKRYTALEKFNLYPAKVRRPWKFPDFSKGKQFSIMMRKLYGLEYCTKHIKFGNPRLLTVKDKLQSCLKIVEEKLKCYE